jgi:hypothetical protein
VFTDKDSEAQEVWAIHLRKLEAEAASQPVPPAKEIL